MRSYTLSKRDTNEVLDSVRQTWPAAAVPGKIKTLRIVEIDDKRSLLLAESFAAVRLEEVVLPFLQALPLLGAFPAVEVDAGAVPFVIKGADIMRPGITRWHGEFVAGATVVVRDERYQRYLATGRALVPRSEAESMQKGPVLKSLHHVGDKFWEAYKTVRV